MTHAHPLRPLADWLDAQHSQILERWHDRVRRDASLATTSEWTKGQFYDHFPDVLAAYLRILRCWPEEAVIAEAEHFGHAHAHAKTRWLQGFSLHNMVREWSHFNAAMVVEFSAARAANLPLQAGDFSEGELIWADLVGVQLAEGATKYQRLRQAEAATRGAELGAMLETVRDIGQDHARALSDAVAGLRGDLSTVMTSNALADTAATEAERAELHAMSREGVVALDRALSDMLLLTRLEAGLEERQIAAYDAGEVLTLLVTGLQPWVEQAKSQLTWSGPDCFPVEGDGRRVALLARHLILSALLGGMPGPVDVEWGDDPREPGRWVFTVRHHAGRRSTPSSPPIARAIAEATERAQQTAGVAPTGFEGALKAGLIPVAAHDGTNVLIAKRLSTLLDASIELEADDGVATFRVSYPRRYG